MSGSHRRRKINWWFVVACSALVALNVFLAVLLIDSLIEPGKETRPTGSVSPTVEMTQTSTQAPTEESTEPSAATQAPTEAVTQPSTEAPTQPPTQAPTQPPTETSTEPAPTETVAPPPETTAPPQQPAGLAALLRGSGVTWGKLQQKGCSQLITVVADGTKAKLCFFTCEEGIWQELPELSCQGYVGRKGVSGKKQEGDGCTPTGLYGIGSAFYIQTLPDTGLDAFQITDKTYWVDDPNSKFYNQKVEGTQNKDWNSAEHMISYDAYRYGFVVEYNLQAVKNAGSAIFFHIGDSSTSGCIATGEHMVLDYLKELDREQNPHILIIRSDDV